MKKFLRAFAAFAIIAATITSCAEKEDENIYDIEQRSFDAWMEKNVIPQNPDNVVRYDNGMYIEWINRVPQGINPAYGNWIKLNYTGRTLSGDVYKTRYKEIAQQENTFTKKTNYIPAYINFYEGNGLTVGENFAIGKMKIGEKLIAYIPSRLAYDGASKKFSNGYGGHYSITSGTMPVKIELELVDIVENASVREQELLNKCIEANGIIDETGENGNKLRDGLYVKILSKHTDPVDPANPTDEEKKKKEDGAYTVVDKNDELYIYRDVYVIQNEAQGNLGADEPKEGPGFGLFLVGTDRSKLADLKWDDFTPYIPTFVKPSLSSENVVFAIREAMLQKKINYMSSFMVVTSSEFTYGKNGYYPSTEPYGEIPPYTPLLIKVYVEKKTYKEGGELLEDFGTPVQVD